MPHSEQIDRRVCWVTGRVFNRPKFSGRRDFIAKKFGRQCTKSRSHAVSLQENSSKNLMQSKALLHCASKNILNIFNCNLKKDYRILINFGNTISETTGHQSIMSFFYLTHRVLLHYLGKSEPLKYCIFP